MDLEYLFVERENMKMKRSRHARSSRLFSREAALLEGQEGGFKAVAFLQHRLAPKAFMRLGRVNPQGLRRCTS
jgi:hypothetical protein